MLVSQDKGNIWNNKWTPVERNLKVEVIKKNVNKPQKTVKFVRFSGVQLWQN